MTVTQIQIRTNTYLRLGASPSDFSMPSLYSKPAPVETTSECFIIPANKSSIVVGNGSCVCLVVSRRYYLFSTIPAHHGFQLTRAYFWDGATEHQPVHRLKQEQCLASWIYKNRCSGSSVLRVRPQGHRSRAISVNPRTIWQKPGHPSPHQVSHRHVLNPVVKPPVVSPGHAFTRATAAATSWSSNHFWRISSTMNHNDSHSIILNFAREKTIVYFQEQSSSNHLWFGTWVAEGSATINDPRWSGHQGPAAAAPQGMVRRCRTAQWRTASTSRWTNSARNALLASHWTQKLGWGGGWAPTGW